MQTWIFFIQSTFNPQEVLSVLLDENDQIISPLELRDITIWPQQGLTQNNRPDLIQKFALVLPAEMAKHVFITLPKLPRSKAKQAIEFSLEPSLAEPIENIHFNFNFDESLKLYEVSAIQKSYLTEILNIFHQYELYPNHIYTDASLLKMNEGMIIQNRYIIKTSETTGALIQGFESYHEHIFHHITMRCEQLPIKTFDTLTYIKQETPLELILAQRTLEKPKLDLAIYEFAPKRKKTNKLKYSLKNISFILFITWLLSYFLTFELKYNYQAQHLHNLRQEVDNIRSKLAPTSLKNKPPQFIIAQLLKQNYALTASLWPILLAVENDKIKIESFRYEHGVLILRFDLNNFEELVKVKKDLQKNHVLVKQKEARQIQNKINIILELSK